MFWSRFLPLGFLLLILGTQLPIFLQMTLTPDAVLYDLQTRCLLEGGVLYRDMVEPNLPGVVWVHTLIRSVAGWSPVALRGFDVMVVLGIALLLSRFVVQPLSEPIHKQIMRGMFLSGLLLFYFSTSEWCHCQRDTWMLLPCMLAAMVRWHVWKRLPGSQSSQSDQQLLSEPGHSFNGRPQATESANAVACGSPLNESKTFAGPMDFRSIVMWGVLEGILWGLGFWLKPFVAIPAVAVLLGSRTRSFTSKGWANTVIHPLRRCDWWIEVAAVLFGGVITGGIGIAWMIHNGCWPHFLEMLTEWNGDYFHSGRSHWTLEKYFFHVERFWPWVLLHVPALIISARGVWRRLRRMTSHSANPGSMAETLLVSLYLGWIIQAFALQQMFDYIHVPGLMLAMAVCSQASAGGMRNLRQVAATMTESQVSLRSMIIPVAIGFLGLCVVSSPVCRSGRQRHWLACVQACAGTPLKPHVRDDLALCPLPRWTELQPLLDRIHELAVPDRSVMAYSGNLVHLYPALRLHPPTRFVYLDTLARCFPGRRPEMLAELEHSGIRFVVSNLIEDGWEGDLSGTTALPFPLLQRTAKMFFPYNQTPLFRSGSYVLFEVNRPIGWLTSESCPLSRQGSWWRTFGNELDD